MNKRYENLQWAIENCKRLKPYTLTQIDPYNGIGYRTEQIVYLEHVKILGLTYYLNSEGKKCCVHNKNYIKLEERLYE